MAQNDFYLGGFWIVQTGAYNAAYNSLISKFGAISDVFLNFEIFICQQAQSDSAESNSEKKATVSQLLSKMIQALRLFEIERGLVRVIFTIYLNFDAQCIYISHTTNYSCGLKCGERIVNRIYESIISTLEIKFQCIYCEKF